jgi:hypothetical protein
MIYLRAACFWTVLVFLCSGCIVQSLYPYYTQESRIALPEVAGKWQLVRELGSDLEAANKKAEEKGEKITVVTPWTIAARTPGPGVTGYDVTSYDRNNREGKLYATFFTVDGQNYCDVMPTAPPKEASRYWYYNVYSVHVLFRVELKDGLLRLRFLDRQWMEKAIEAKEVTFPVVDKSRRILLNATAEEWKKFLEKYGKTEGVFSDKNPMELRRVKDDAAAPGTETKKETPKAEPEKTF